MLTVAIRLDVLNAVRAVAHADVEFTAPIDILKDDIQWDNLIRRLVVDTLRKAEDAADDTG